MSPSSLATTNVLLGIMAAVSVIQLIGLATAAVLGYRAYVQVLHRLETLEAEHVAPLTSRTSAILDDVKRLTERAESRADSLDQHLTASARRAGEAARHLRSRAAHGWHELEGVATGVREAIRVLWRGDADRRADPRRDRATDDVMRGA